MTNMVVSAIKKSSIAQKIILVGLAALVATHAVPWFFGTMNVFGWGVIAAAIGIPVFRRLRRHQDD